MSSSSNQSENFSQLRKSQSENVANQQVSGNCYFDRFLSDLEDTMSHLPSNSSSQSLSNANVFDPNLFSEFPLFDSNDSIFDKTLTSFDASNSVNCCASVTDAVTFPLSFTDPIQVVSTGAVNEYRADHTDQQLMLKKKFEDEKSKPTSKNPFQYPTENERVKDSKDSINYPKNEKKFMKSSALLYRTVVSTSSLKKPKLNTMSEDHRKTTEKNHAGLSQENDICDISPPSSGCQSEDERCSIIR